MDAAFSMINGVKNVRSTIDTLYWLHALYVKVRKKINVKKSSKKVNGDETIEENWEEL